MLTRLFSSIKSFCGIDNSQPRLTPRSKHNISRSNIDKNALKVLYRLKNAGYQSYLVGGGIRDLLLGIEPKDFDIATDAYPEQIRKLFNNCRLIGRRFRLAHIYFGNEIIEVATFRADHEDHIKTDSGMLLKDNIYGSIDEDVLRRDFTINAIYYNIKDFSLIDYVGGLEDIAKRQLRIIGDPFLRYREDPVRMLRAIRLASKLDLKLHRNTADAIIKSASLLQEVSRARLFDEYLKLFTVQKLEFLFNQLIHYGLFAIMFPQLVPYLKDKYTMNFIKVALLDAEKRMFDNKSVSPLFIVAVFLWRPVLTKIKENSCKVKADVMHNVLNLQRDSILIPKRLIYIIVDIWLLQFKLEKITLKNVTYCHKAAHFVMAYDFLLLRYQSGDQNVISAVQWWQNYMESNERIRKQMLKNLAHKKGKKHGHNKH